MTVRDHSHKVSKGRELCGRQGDDKEKEKEKEIGKLDQIEKYFWRFFKTVHEAVRKARS